MRFSFSSVKRRTGVLAWKMESREEGSCCLSERDHKWSILRHSMGGARPLYCLTVDMMLIGFHLSKDPVPSEHVTYHRALWMYWFEETWILNATFLSIQTLHVTVDAVAACLIWLVCLINMDADEISADRILWVSDEYQILNDFMLLCTGFLQGLIFHSYQSQRVIPIVIWCISKGNIEDREFCKKDSKKWMLIFIYFFICQNKSMMVNVWKWIKVVIYCNFKAMQKIYIILFFNT